MSAPRPPGPEGQGWSEGWGPEYGAAGNPPTQEFAAQQQYGDPQYPEPQYQDPQYQDPRYQGSQYPDQGYPPGAEATQYYAQQPPPDYGPGDYGPAGYAPPPAQRTPGWAWALLGVVIIGLLGGLGYFAATQLSGSDDGPAAANRPAGQVDGATGPAAVTPSSRPDTSQRRSSAAPTTTARPTLVNPPANAKPCPITERTADFQSSAVADNTSCPFAEEVRLAYLQQSKRGAAVSVQAFSPTTNKMYTMECSGVDLVTCTGGNAAVVYVY